MQESLDFRKKFLFYIQVLSAAAERADDERNDESNEFQGTHKDNLLGRIVIHEPYMSTNSTEWDAFPAFTLYLTDYMHIENYDAVNISWMWNK